MREAKKEPKESREADDLYEQMSATREPMPRGLTGTQQAAWEAWK